MRACLVQAVEARLTTIRQRTHTWLGEGGRPRARKTSPSACCHTQQTPNNMTRLLPIVLLFIAPHACSAAALATSAKSFRDCCKKKPEVDVERLLSATKQYCEMLSRFGRFVGPSIANVRQCMEKVEKARRELKKDSDSKLKKVKELLKLEGTKGIHKKGGVLADPSAAMGLLWLRRGLEFWADVFEQEARILGLQKKGKLKGEPPTLQSQCAAAYKRTVEPFHGWISRRAFAAAQGMTPSWEEVRERACLGCDSDEAFQKELASLAAATRELCELLQKVHVKYDMEDKRRSI